ncbi:MAG TPA: phosphotransferase [Ornithinimicrobium sp.]|nr:phosphotransferase [Ornithinimicrobium sp.]
MRSDLALAALASAAVPGMKPVAVAAIGPADDDSPMEHQQALVEDTTGRRWLVRAPLTPVAGARLQQHDELVRQLSRHVPFKVPAPVGYADVGPDGRAAVYPFVEGSPVDLRRVPSGPGLASALARAIAAVHNIPRGAFEEQDVPVLDAAACRQRLIAEVDRAAETGRVPTGLLARWEEAFDAAPLWQFATTPVHGRFRGSTVLVTFADDDAASARVVAVTGWEEAAVSDPAVDLAELSAQASPQAWSSVLESYTLARAQRPDPYLHVRARLHAEVRTLRGLATAVAEDRGEAVRRAEEALRRMDRLTEDDDALVPVTARGPAAVADAAEVVADPVADDLAADDVHGPAGDVSRGVEDEASSVTEDVPVEDHPQGNDRSTEDHPVADESVALGPVAVDDPRDVHDHEDATMEVPVPGRLRATEPATPGSTGQDQGADPVEADEKGENGENDDDQAAGPRDGPDAEDLEADPGSPPSDDDQGETDELDDEHRLTELYGMPVEPDVASEDDRPTTAPPAEQG